MKKVVICIPAYNSEATIARTLDSLLNQDYPIWKILVFDNQSTDNTVSIVSEYSSKHSNINVFVNEKNLGAEGNFTKCIQAAEGDYCAILHADDLYNINYVSTSVQALETHHGCVASFCGALEINSHENVIGERFYPSELGEKDFSVINLEKLLSLTFKYANFITCPSVMVRSDVYKNNIKFWNGERFKSSADLDVWLRLAQFGNLVGIREKIMRYRVAEESYSFRIAKKRISKHDIFTVLDYYKSLYQSSLNATDEENYYFLNLKDQALRCLNIIRTKKTNEDFPKEVRFHFSIVLKKMLSSKWHFKMGVAIIGIRILSGIMSLMRRKP